MQLVPGLCLDPCGAALQLKRSKGVESNSNQIELSQIKQAQHSITFDQTQII